MGLIAQSPTDVSPAGSVLRTPAVTTGVVTTTVLARSIVPDNIDDVRDWEVARTPPIAVLGVVTLPVTADPIVPVGFPEPTPVEPNTPSCVVVSRSSTSVQLGRGSAYSHPDALAQMASRWQVALSSDPTFSAPIADTAFDPDLTVGAVLGGLTAATDYLARVADAAVDGRVSNWSASVSFTTLADAAEVPTTWDACLTPPSSLWASSQPDP